MKHLDLSTRYVLASLACLTLVTVSCGVTSRSDAVAELAGEIQRKTPEEIHAIIVNRLGRQSRHVGSGFDIEEWDIAGGTLTYHPAVGVFFRKNGERKRLLQTSNRVGECLFGSYEMATTAIQTDGVRYWLGNLRLESNGAYQFTDSGQFPEQRSGQRGNFFFEHPTGTSRVSYSKGITADSILEQLPHNSRIAEIVFTTADKSASATYSISSSDEDTRLKFESDTPQSFEMDKSWEHYWNYRE